VNADDSVVGRDASQGDASQAGGKINVKELIRRKRDGAALHPQELRDIAAGIADGRLTDAQVAAFAMAVFFRGLDATELPAFTLGMRDSGTVLDWSGIDRPVLDKHSTGGVGDKVSLLLAPIVAACGGAVPMLSGRGLGHTGGTLDKLEAIPGYDTAPDPARLRAVVERAGCAIVGQTDDLAPADRRLYATRDATGSVESIPLIVSSILSKKLAAGLGSLVLDVKHGSGAFMAELDDARALARALVDVAVAAGLPTVALLTDMDSALGTSAGNALEVRECLDVLMGLPGDERLVDVTLALCEVLLELGGLDADPADALRSGAAAERFAAMTAALGGPADLLERPGAYLRTAAVTIAVEPERAGVVTAHATRDLGLVVLDLGGGRHRDGEAIDHAVGLSEIAGLGDDVAPGGRPLCVVHARDDDAAAAAAEAVRKAIAVGDNAPPEAPIVTEDVR
jgi:thymidine phosphorylase